MPTGFVIFPAFVTLSSIGETSSLHTFFTRNNALNVRHAIALHFRLIHLELESSI